MLAQAREGDVLAAANQGLGAGQFFQLGTEGKGALEAGSEAAESASFRKQGAGGIEATGGGITGNPSFDQRQLQAADASGFAGTVNGGHRSLLEIVHRNFAIL